MRQKNWTSPLNSAYSKYQVPNVSLNWQFWLFRQTKFTQKGDISILKQKVSTTTEFCMYELVRNFSLKWQFWFFGPNLPKKGVSGLKQKEWTPPINYNIRISLPSYFIFSCFSCFAKFFILHKWKKGWLVLINMGYTSCLTSSRAT